MPKNLHNKKCVKILKENTITITTLECTLSSKAFGLHYKMMIRCTSLQRIESQKK